MPQPEGFDRADYVESRLGADMVERAGRSDLIVDELNPNRFAGDPPGKWVGDKRLVPLWVWALTQAFLARYVPPELTLSTSIALVEPDAERRNGLAMMARLSGFRPGDVIALLLEWQEAARAQGGVPPVDRRR